VADPSGRFPLGVLTRHPADWFDEECATGGYSIEFGPPAGNNYVLVSLFNNSTGGQVLKIYGMTAISDGGAGCVAWADAGSPSGLFVGACTNIRPDYAAPAGLIYQNTITQHDPLPNPFTYPASAPVLGGSGFDSFTYLSPFPLFIIPAGYSLHVLNVYAAGIVGGSFWYQVANA
jgi:hypothetical protein